MNQIIIWKLCEAIYMSFKLFQIYAEYIMVGFILIEIQNIVKISDFFLFNSFHNNLSKSAVFHCLQKWRRQILANSIININCQISFLIKMLNFFQQRKTIRHLNLCFFVAPYIFTLFARQERRMRRMGMIKKKILL